MTGDRDLTSDDVVGYDGPDGPARFAADLAAWEACEAAAGWASIGPWPGMDGPAQVIHFTTGNPAGNDWATTGPVSGAWPWAVYRDTEVRFHGTESTEAAAKAAATDAYRTGGA